MAPPTALSVRLRDSVPWTASRVNRLTPCSDAAANRYSGAQARYAAHECQADVTRHAARAVAPYRARKMAARGP